MEQRKLKVGLLLEDYCLSAWTHKMLIEIMESDYADIDLVVLNEQPDSEKIIENKSLLDKIKNNSGRLPHVLVKKVLLTTYSKLIDRNLYLPDAFEAVNCEELFSDIPAIKVTTKKQNGQTTLVMTM